MLQRWVIALTAVWVSVGAIAGAQDRATVQMRDGSKFEGRIEELTGCPVTLLSTSPEREDTILMRNPFET